MAADVLAEGVIFMPIDGVTVLNSLEGALADSLAAVKTGEDRAGALERQLDELVADRGEALVELARHYLPAITQQAIDTTFAELRDDLRNIVARKQRQQRQLQEQIATATDSQAQLNMQLEACTRELNDLVARRAEAEADLAARLAADTDFQRLSGALTQARIQLAENERRLAEIHAEAAEKLPAYESSRLFQYLLARRFAEPDYRGRGLTRRLDRWVAGLIDFGRARQSYHFLRVTPELADAEVRRRREDLERLDAAAERIERETSEARGLPEIVERGQQLGSQRDRLLDQLEQNREQLEPLEREHAELTPSQGAFYDEAIARFKRFLEQAHTALLEQRAAATPERADDEIVAQIKWLDEQIDQHKNDVSVCRQQRQEVEQCVRGLRYVIGRCQRSNLDSQRGYFEDGFEIGRLLDQFRALEFDEHKLLRTIRDQLRFHPTWAEETGKKIGTAFEHPAAQTLVGAATAVAAEGLRRVVARHGGGFTRDRGF